MRIGISAKITTISLSCVFLILAFSACQKSDSSTQISAPTSPETLTDLADGAWPGFSGPTGMAVSPDSILVTAFADDGNGRLFVFDRSGKFQKAVTLGPVSAPDEVLVSDRAAWIMDFSSAELLRLSGTAVEERIVLPERFLPGVPKGIAWLGGYLYVANGTPAIIAEYNPQGRLGRVIPTPFELIGGIASDGVRLYAQASREGEGFAVYVGSVSGNAFQIERSFGAGDVGVLGGIAVGSDGTVYTVDETLERMAAFDQAGKKSSSFGTGIIGHIGAVAIVDGDIWVADEGGGRILIYHEDGQPKGIFAPPNPIVYFNER